MRVRCFSAKIILVCFGPFYNGQIAVGALVHADLAYMKEAQCSVFLVQSLVQLVGFTSFVLVSSIIWCCAIMLSLIISIYEAVRCVLWNINCRCGSSAYNYMSRLVNYVAGKAFWKVKSDESVVCAGVRDILLMHVLKACFCRWGRGKHIREGLCRIKIL